MLRTRFITSFVISSRIFSLFVTCIFLNTSALGNSPDLDNLFEELKETRENYRIVGTICEQVARLELMKEYGPDLYSIKTGINYFDQKRTIGELDVVVFNKADGEAVLIGEVKCWHNLKGAHKKAAAQRQRFIKTISSNQKLRLCSVADRTDCYDQDRFLPVPQFIFISQDGGGTQGFDYTLKFSLDELMSLRERLISYQEHNAYNVSPYRR